MVYPPSIGFSKWCKVATRFVGNFRAISWVAPPLFLLFGWLKKGCKFECTTKNRHDVVLPYAGPPYANSPQSIRHSQFAICASSPYYVRPRAHRNARARTLTLPT